MNHITVFFISQLVRLGRINSSFNGFVSVCKSLVRKLERQSFDIALLTIILIFGENLELLSYAPCDSLCSHSTIFGFISFLIYFSIRFT